MSVNYIEDIDVFYPASSFMSITNDIDILVVEDNPADLLLVKQMLRTSPLRINKLYSTDKVVEAKEVLSSENFHITLLDLSLPDSFGLDTYLGIKSSTKKIPVIILTGLNDTDVALEALKQGAQDYLIKGEFNTHLLCRAIQYSLERKHSEEALLISEEKYRQMFYQNPFPAGIYDAQTLKILEVNDAAVNKYGYTRNEFLNLTLKDLLISEDIPQSIQTLRNSDGQSKLWRHKKKNGEIMMVEVTFYPVTYFGRQASQAQIHDVTEQIKLQEQLRQQEKEKEKNITAAVLEALERDRAYLGEELHDNINQILATAKLYLEYLKTNRDAKEDVIDRPLAAVNMAIEEIRKLSKRLIVSDIKEIGLKSSIEQLISSIMHVKQLDVELNMKNFPEKKLSEDLKIAIYRIVQEHFTNILKHADAKKVTVDIKKNKNQITIEIADDGKGFDPSKKRKGVGITNITSRAKLYDGEVNIHSAPGKGFTLNVSLHIKN